MPFINEFHYDNAGTDAGEFIEIAGVAGTSLAGWQLVLYNGNPSQRTSYNTISLSGTFGDQQNGFGTLSFSYPANGIQNGGSGAAGEPDAIALVDPLGNVVEFISYEGVFVAANGPAAGLTSVNVGVGIFEDGTANGTSIGRIGSGTNPGDFTWALITDDTPGGVNLSQSFGDVVPPSAGTLDIADASTAEGNSGTHDIVFTVTRSGGSAGAVSATWTVTLPGSGNADASDFGAGTVFTGTVNFAAGATTAEIHLPVLGDTAFESSETFTVTLSNPVGGVTLGDAVATGTIANDDAAPPAAPANVFVNEIHYDNSGTDVGEAIEIAGVAGTDLTGYKLVLYNGTNTPGAAPVYSTTNLSGVIDDEGNGYGALSFSYAVNGIQNGPADGVALIAPDGTVVQFLSYGGTITAAAGTPAAGHSSTDIGVAESPAPGAGFSLQLTGTGSSAGDFTWTAPADDSFGSLNTGQSFLPATGTSHIRVDDAQVIEGDSGTQSLVFTVHRAGGQSAAVSVGYSVVLDGTADGSDLGAGAVLNGTVSFGVGEFTKTITIPVSGDTLGERNETLHVVLTPGSGDVTIDDGSATGTITNDDPIPLVIGEIQGAGHQSTYVGQTVITSGVVTAVDSNGFYLQDAAGDGNAATSDAIFVFTSGAPTVVVGDGVSVSGTVAEFAGDTAGLTVTELTAPTVTIASHGNALPGAVLIGEHGVLPPSNVIDDDGLTSFDPVHDGIDFWESLEGMRVTIETPQVVSNTTSFGETDVVASLGHGATGMNGRGGISIAAGDYNPEKIQIDDDSGIFAGFTPGYTIGDQLSNVTGIVNYSFDHYEVLVTEAVSVTADVTLEREQTSLKGDATHLSMATYNVENLDASDNKFDILASNIVYNLQAPDIIALQEIQDTDGAGSGSDLSGTVTAQGLIDAIYAESGLHYAYIEIAPTTAGSTGGEPGGNIRSGYLYNVDRVSYVAGSAELITGAAYDGSRKPLVATWSFMGQNVTTIDVHLTSRLGSDQLWGNSQPPADAGDASRTAQAAGIKAWINDHLADNPSLNIAVLGDWNGFYFENAQTQLTDPAQGGVLTNLNALLTSEERYSYMFDGNAQQIDNILVTDWLFQHAQYDSVHINSQFAADARATDHDPQVALFQLLFAPTDLALSNASVAENLLAGTVVGTLSAHDSAGDTLTYALTDDAGGRFHVDAATGVVTTTAPLDHETAASYAITGKVTDQTGLSTSAGFTVTVGDVNEAPVAVQDAVAVNEDATSGNLWSLLLGNDHDPDAGDTLTIQSVNTTGTLGHVIFDPAHQTLQYVADHDAFDALAPGATLVDHLVYTVSDANGLTSTAAVDVTVTGVSDGVKLYGTIFGDTLNGGNGEDYLWGGLGADTLNGNGGHDQLIGGLGNDKLNGGDGNDLLWGDLGNDVLNGGNGNDILFGGLGEDILTGGAGADMFHFGRLEGGATITDFDVVNDRIVLDDGVRVNKTKVADVNHDGIKDTTLTLSLGTSVTLLGVSDASKIQYAAPDYYSDHQPGLGGLLDDIGDFFGRIANPWLSGDPGL